MVIVSVAVIRWRNRTQFFFQDEWSVLAGRSLSDVSSIIEPHWGHNIVLPAVAYLSLFEVFGLREYAPYQALVIGAHLVVVGCLRVIMVRAGVHTWITLSACAPCCGPKSSRNSAPRAWCSSPRTANPSSAKRSAITGTPSSSAG